jgi:acetyl-CoA/propionyl-CoA carboxylase biotin carboxyl carrier protein
MSDATTPRPPRATRPVLVTVAAASAHPDDPVSVVVEPGEGPALSGHGPLVGRVGADDVDGRRSVEVMVDGCRFEFVVEDAARAALRQRASRDRGSGSAAGGATEIRAVIPGRVASVAVVAGDTVEAGQALLAVEAMKMQNELRAPRAGTVERVPATAGSTVEVGDLLVVLT